jgi:hypothetical protein
VPVDGAQLARLGFLAAPLMANTGEVVFTRTAMMKNGDSSEATSTFAIKFDNDDQRPAAPPAIEDPFNSENRLPKPALYAGRSTRWFASSNTTAKKRLPH